MQIKRSIEKIPGGMMLVPLFLGALCHTFSPGAGKYFGSFTNGMITGTVPILAVWFFCMGASIKLSATGTVLRKSGTLVVTKIAVAWVVAAIASRIIPEHGVEVGFFAGLSTLAVQRCQNARICFFQPLQLRFQQQMNAHLRQPMLQAAAYFRWH